MHQAIRDIYHTTTICCGGECNVDNTSGNINSLVGEQKESEKICMLILHHVFYMFYISKCNGLALLKLSIQRRHRV